MRGVIMARLDLRVPFAEKDVARRLGARWDPQQKVWYVPDGVDPTPLRKWVPLPIQPNIRSATYFIATTDRQCWRCFGQTQVWGIMLPAGHEVFQVDDDPADDHWEVMDELTLLSYIGDLPDRVSAHLHDLAPQYRIDYSQTTQSFYWMNHCEHCAAKLGDFDTNNEFGLGFDPASAAQAATIRLCEMFETFAASCGVYTCGVDLFEHMDICGASRSSSREPSS
jgi:hypothetical protein